jgi:hypothetical protein
MTVPQPEAHLLYLAAYAILQHGEAQVYLLRYFDLHLLITRNELDWELVVEQAVTWGWTLAIERALRRAVEFFATPVPESVFDALVKRRPDCEDTSRVIRLQGPGHRREHLRVSLAGLSRWERLQLLSEILFPTPAYMRQRYRIRPGWPSWPYYAYRWVDQGREVVAALRRRVSGYR